MPAENNAFCATILRDRTLELHGQLESWPLPWQPNDLSPELPIEFVELLSAICAGGESDGPIGVKMIDMFEWKECMQRRIYGSSDFVFAESRKRIIADHLICVDFAAVQTLALIDPIKIKDLKPRLSNRSDRKSTRLNSSHRCISYAVFCCEKKK